AFLHQRRADSPPLIRGIDVKPYDLEGAFSSYAGGRLAAGTQIGVSHRALPGVLGHEHGDVAVGNRRTDVIYRECAGEVSTQLGLGMRRAVRLGEQSRAEGR